ncbi:MAG: O-antigen ligase family protein [Bacteroidota bacterium]
MDLTYTPVIPGTASRGASRYLAVLGGALLGYALFSRTFAYLGVPPLFVGELLLAAGLVFALTSGKLREVLGTWPVRIWMLLAAWTLARTVPYLGTYGLDAPRDAMIVVYGAYAIVVASLVLADPERLVTAVRRYGAFATVMLSLAWIVYLAAKQLGESQPGLPWAPDVKLLIAKGGDLMVHMTGITAFLVLGFQKRSALWFGLAAFSAGIIMVSNRGGMVAFVLGLGLAWLLRPPGTFGRSTRLVYAFVALVVVGAIAGPVLQLQVQGGSRDLTIEQVVENVTSIFTSSGSTTLDGTKRWRLLWWGEIVDYTLTGPYFVTGKGFGVNLAESDGFTLDVDEGLRSPHNGHLTILARAGVPGAVLWFALHLAWFASLLRAWGRARLADQRRWTALFAWIAAIWLASLLNASFDVFLEGPMGGIWVWSVIGLGIAATRLQRTHPALLGDAPAPPPPPVPTFASRHDVRPPAPARAPADPVPTWSW